MVLWPKIEQLTPNVLAALADAGITVTDLTTVVVGCGPGPFTGLRVGMATAAAYGQALGIPVGTVKSRLSRVRRALRLADPDRTSDRGPGAVPGSPSDPPVSPDPSRRGGDHV